MRVLNGMLWVSAAVVTLGLLGCGGRTIVVHENQPRHVAVVEEPGYVIVREAPPAVIIERRPPPPSQLHIWVDGYWHWNSTRYVWTSGQWSQPPRGGAVWVAPRYERQEHGYRYAPGRWSDGGPARGGNDDRGRGGDDRGRGGNDDRGRGGNDDRGRR